MKRIVVTGKNGQLASELRIILEKEENFECFFLGRNEFPLEETKILHDVLGMYQPDIIIHTAAYTAVDQAEEELDAVNTINHLASEQIAEYCTLHNVKLIYISTDYVFDGTSEVPLTENIKTHPINAYGHSKHRGEIAVRHFAPRAIILRTSWVYSSFGNNFVKTMLHLMEEKKKLQVVADQWGLPTYARDLAQAISIILKADKWMPGIYHYANRGEGITWFDFASAIRDITKKEVQILPITTEEFVRPANRPKYSVLDSSKIQKTFNFEIPSWQKSLEEMLTLLKTTN
ncbi:MAG TPA: dTDP-4-dehydrorhamnose reductase [Sphingobacterium sp.]|nr:dTDP-4-dehydrorhamnose reductase [Sphingobacterium sp.]